MQIAIPTRHGRVSPVFDTAARLVIVRRNRDCIFERREIELDLASADTLARRLADLGIDVLVCAAVSEPLRRTLEARGIRLVIHVCGEVDTILDAFCHGRLDRLEFRMPGCGGRLVCRACSGARPRCRRRTGCGPGSPSRRQQCRRKPE
jgi:predicted Fe-Mo cluster-binding NifX family protein